MKSTSSQNQGSPGIFGPGHSIRWNWHVRDGVVPSDIPFENIHGLGGAPIWSKRLFEAAEGHVSKGGSLLVMVGDFRFGNAVALAPDTRDLFADKFLGIDSKALTSKIDQEMRTRGLKGLQVWVEKFGSNARFIFWDLFGRQVFDRLGGRYIADGRYQHPVFNYAEIVEQFPKADVVDLAPLLQRPMHEVRRLFIDLSCHPSQIGYLFLNEALCKGRDVLSAYRDAVNEVEAILFSFARRIAAANGRPVLVTGRSVWLDTLMGYLDAPATLRLAEEGLVLAPLVSAPGQPSIAKMMQKVPLDQCTPLVLSAGGRDISSDLAHAFGTSKLLWTEQPVVDWEEATKPGIISRGETPRHIYAEGTGSKAAEVIEPTLSPHMVEQGPNGVASWTGIVHLLEQIATGEMMARTQKGAQSSKQPAIKAFVEDVLLTKDDIAFLIGGNHSVLKFVTGEKKPTPSSLQAFGNNIAARRRVAQSTRAAYAHVIFPDKQSVLSDAFPYQPVQRLGELYSAELPADLKDSVIYPVDTLRNAAQTPFLPLDTHLTDHGSMEVLRLVSDKFAIDARATIDHVQTRICRPQRWPGDLGNKFSPPLIQETKVLDPDWPVTQLRSPGGFNDGMIDILLNPAAAKDATLLMFGDSFFRMMLTHLSAVFSRVIHLRSRFLHPEMVTLIEPDYVLTGNAERYLSNVSADTEAHAFSLYPQLRNAKPVEPDKEFLAAWRAVTSPRSEFAAKYFAADRH